MPRLAAVAALASLALLAPTANAAPGPQITDPANDANGVNSQAQPNLSGVPNNTPSPAGSQAYADVLSVQWTTLKTTKIVKRKKVTTVTGFSVKATLSAAPTPPQGTVLVYRMLGSTPLCGFFGVAYYTKPLSDPTTPQTALRDNCIDTTTRLTALAPAVVKDATITWTVPLSVIPKDTKVGNGSALTGLYFTVTEIEDFQGQKVPAEAPVYGGATGLGLGVLDDSVPGAAAFKIGS